MKTPFPGNPLWNGLAIVSHCPLCEASLDPLEAKVLGENERSHLLHIKCRSCGHALLALVMISRGGISSLGLVTDCTSEDALRFQGGTALGEDDVLATHVQLGRDRDFIRALQG